MPGGSAMGLVSSRGGPIARLSEGGSRTHTLNHHGGYVQLLTGKVGVDGRHLTVKALDGCGTVGQNGGHNLLRSRLHFGANAQPALGVVGDADFEHVGGSDRCSGKVV